ncbi:hypothetical protein LR48_Vigan04g096700 [Vigna angularis]|uniref:Uncharacterized protein n=1 Tax=Phaseolus angularis TaxID=3914 RepID=A0A0L9UE01_PHAAN|nr:hypothetical protein LR48_Vigan04g096700 [Vigna angularis]
MKTPKVIINVDDGMIVLEDQEEKVIFNVFNVEQQIQEKKTNHKAACKDALVTSPKAAKPVIKGRNCFLSQVREEEKDDKGRMVHDDLVDAQFKLGTPVRFKNKLWVVRDFKDNGVIEIEAPYSRRVKKVDRKQLMSWCDESKNTNIKDGT